MTPTRGVSRRSRPKEGWAEQVLPGWLTTAVIVVLLIIVLVPILYMVGLSLTDDRRAALGGIDLGDLRWDNYVTIWSTAPLARGLVNTIVIAGISALASVLLGLLAAYPLARFAFRGRKGFLTTLIGVQTVPGTTLLLPLFVVFASIQSAIGVQFIGGYVAPVITYMTFGLPMSTWLLFSYIRTIPPSLDEAALVDGCSRAGALFRVVVPITAPAAAVAFVFAFLVGWNDVLFATVLTRENTQTLSIAMRAFSSVESGAGIPVYGQLMAGAVVSAVPVIVLYLCFQRYLVHGLAGGSVAGT